MSDFLAGQTLTDGHFPPTVASTQAGSFSFDSTSYGIDADSGTYLDCGVAFLGPATGRVIIGWTCRLTNNTAGQATFCAPVVRAGAVVGSGASVLAASDDNAIQLTTGSAANVMRCGASLLLEGLTPGDSYNVRLEHRVSANTGNLLRRHVIVSPAT